MTEPTPAPEPGEGAPPRPEGQLAPINLARGEVSSLRRPATEFLVDQSQGEQPHDDFHPDERHDDLLSSDDSGPVPLIPSPTRYSPRGSRLAIQFFGWLLIASLLAFLAIVVLYVVYARGRLAATSTKTTKAPVVVTIDQGDTFLQISQRLEKAGLLRSYLFVPDRWLFRYHARAQGNSNRLHHGTFTLAEGMTIPELYAALLQAVAPTRVVIPEGLNIQATAALVAKRIPALSADRFTKLANDPKFIATLDLHAPSLEGYLYPSAYEFKPDITEEDLLRRMVRTFREVAEMRLAKSPKPDNLSFHEHLIIASLIEKEARVQADRPLIASVIHNRLQKGMRLQIDATVNYALNDWRRLTYADYKVDHPYNTYKINGLPPGPICSPRIESLAATYEFPETDYLFYVSRGDGRHEFAKTLEEHDRNVKYYIRGRNPEARPDDDATTPTQPAPPDDDKSTTPSPSIPPKPTATPRPAPSPKPAASPKPAPAPRPAVAQKPAAAERRDKPTRDKPAPAQKLKPPSKDDKKPRAAARRD